MQTGLHLKQIPAAAVDAVPAGYVGVFADDTGGLQLVQADGTKVPLVTLTTSPLQGIRFAPVPDASAAVSTLYLSSDQDKLVYKDINGVVRALY